jgi:hypothetical protein
MADNNKGSQMDELTLNQLKAEVRDFVQEFSMTPISILYGVTDGKAVGTYVEQAFHKYLLDRYLSCTQGVVLQVVSTFQS